MSAYDETSLARRERIEKLKADIRALEEGTRRLEGGRRGQGAARARTSRRFATPAATAATSPASRCAASASLILLDRSASMLHQDLVNVILLRNSDEAKKRTASKWRRAVDTVNWIVAQLPPDAQFQIYGFNTKADAGARQHRRQVAERERSASLRSKNIEALQRARARRKARASSTRSPP